MNTSPKRSPLIRSVASDQTQFEILRELDARPRTGQRELAASLGVSLGKANYVLRALIGKGFIKAENYRNSTNKLAYLYILTPAGLVAKADLTRRFLDRKIREYESLRLEIAMLRRESAKSGTDSESGGRQ